LEKNGKTGKKGTFLVRNHSVLLVTLR